MARAEKARRPGYAPGHTGVGRRGLRTRDSIVDHALRLFRDFGFHGTSMDAIAQAVGGSRATVYQYFESKDDILLELLAECEPAVLAHAQRLGPLGPTSTGVKHLQGWLDELAELYDRYTAVFLEFPAIGLGQGIPVARAGAVSDAYLAAIADRIRAAGVVGLAADDAAAALLRIAHMINLYRSRRMFELGAASSVTASLTVALQLLLFPDTPDEVLGGAGNEMPGDRPATPPTPFPAHAGPPPDPPVVSPIRQDMLSAASALFARYGFHGVSMEDIAETAQVGRTTLYRHFGTKVAVLAELTEWAVLEGRHLSEELFELAQRHPDAEALHAWLSRYVHFHRNYGAVIRAWYDGTVAQQLPQDTVGQGLGTFRAAAGRLLADVALAPGLHVAVAEAVFLAILGRLSELRMSQHPEDTDYDVARFMTDVLQRTLLGRDSRFA